MEAEGSDYSLPSAALMFDLTKQHVYIFLKSLLKTYANRASKILT